MQTNPLILVNGHPFITLLEATFLLDTGAPTRFGRVSPIMLDGQSFDLPPSYMGLTAQILSSYVRHETDGILGADTLNQFDILINLPQSRQSDRFKVVHIRSPVWHGLNRHLLERDFIRMARIKI